MKKIILLTSLAILSFSMINNSQAEDCPAGKVMGVSSKECIEATGICGANCTYTIDSTGLMTIFGSGPIADYVVDFYHDEEGYEYPKYFDSNGNLAPGHKYAKDLKKVVFAPDSNITRIGNGFLDSSYISDITIPDSVTSIGVNGLYTYTLKSLTIPSSVEYIEDDAIYGKNIKLIITDATNINPLSLANIGEATCIGSLEGCEKLRDNSGGSIKEYTLGDADDCNSSGKHYYSEESCNRTPSTKEDCATTDYYYYTGASCVKRESADSPITCASGYADYKDECWAELPFSKKHWTPAEAAQWLNDDNNMVTITFKY